MFPAGHFNATDAAAMAAVMGAGSNMANLRDWEEQQVGQLRHHDTTTTNFRRLTEHLMMETMELSLKTVLRHWRILPWMIFAVLSTNFTSLHALVVHFQTLFVMK